MLNQLQAFSFLGSLEKTLSFSFLSLTFLFREIAVSANHTTYFFLELVRMSSFISDTGNSFHSYEEKLNHWKSLRMWVLGKFDI